MQILITWLCPPAAKLSESCFSEDAGDTYGGGGDSVKGKSM